MPTHFLKGLFVSHFRSHGAAKLQFDGRPVAIYGPNGAGKTNILEAISLLSPGRGLRRVAAHEMMRRPNSVGWQVRADLFAGGQDHEIKTWSELGASRQVMINEKSASQVALGRLARVLWLVPAMDRLWIEGAEGRRRFIDRATMSFEPSHADAVLSYEKAMRERNRLLKDHVTDDHWYAALEHQMAISGAKIHANRTDAILRLTQAQSAATTAFPIAELQLTHTDEPTFAFENIENLREAFAESRPRDRAAGRTLVGPHRADLKAVFAAKHMEARDCSTGEQKALLISLVLANARALRSEFGVVPIVLLDEVAAHLDAERRAALYDEIVGLDAQAFMTGTGPELFVELDKRAQYVLVQDEQGRSKAIQRDAIDGN